MNGPDTEGGAERPSEEEMRAQLEEEVRKLRVQDVLLQSVASLVNLSARRIGKEDERDLDQARVGIEAVKAVVDLLDPEPRGQIRNALSELQVLYAREAGAAGDVAPPGGEGEEAPGGPERDTGAERTEPRRQRKPPPGLWTPPGSSG